MTGRVPSMEKAPSIVKFLSIVRLPIIGRFPSKVNGIISLFSRIVVNLTPIIIVKTVNILLSMTVRSGSLWLEYWIAKMSLTALDYFRDTIEESFHSKPRHSNE